MLEPIYVTKPYLPPKERLYRYFDEIYDSAWLTNYGPLVRKFEERLKDFLGVKNIITVANGTLALQLTYKAFGLKEKAITTPFSFVATVSSLYWEGIQPVFADISYNSYTIDPQKVREIISSKISGIVPVHVYGNPCNVDELQEIGNEFGIPVIYDAAHTFGVRYKSSSLLNYGNASAISFHATKIFQAIEGGAIITENKEIVEKLRLFSNFGIAGHEDIRSIGINAKMNEYSAAMGLAVLEDAKKILEKYRLNWNLYHDELNGYVTFREPAPETDYNYSYVAVLFRDEKQLLDVVKELNKNQVFPRRYFYPPLDTLSYLIVEKKCPIARDVSSRILALPSFYDLKAESIYRISDIIKKVIRNE